MSGIQIFLKKFELFLRGILSEHFRNAALNKIEM